MRKNKFISPVNSSDLINIQKLVFLLNKGHYDIFHSHLLAIQSNHGARLIETIQKKLPSFHHHEELCIAVYGDDQPETRIRFNQLTLTCFKLSEYLAVNHPNYLAHNIQHIHKFVDNGQRAAANFLAEVLLDMALKVEDYLSQIAVLKFMIQEELLFNKLHKAEKHYEMLEEAQLREKLTNDLIFKSKKEFSFFLASGKKTLEEVDVGIAHYTALSHHPSILVKLLSLYSVLFITFYHKREHIPNVSFKNTFTDFEKLLSQYSYIVHPFLIDLKSFLFYCKIAQSRFEFSSKDDEKDITRFQKHIGMVRYWESYINLPEMFLLNSRYSYYLNLYIHYTHREKYLDMLSPKDRTELKKLAEDCKRGMDRYADKEEYVIDKINQRFMYAGALILSGGNQIKEGIAELEGMFFLFQQVSKSGLIDGAHLVLMIGYFALGEYRKCKAVYKRYLKASQNRHVYAGNELIIQIYWQVSNWLLEKKKRFCR